MSCFGAILEEVIVGHDCVSVGFGVGVTIGVTIGVNIGVTIGFTIGVVIGVGIGKINFKTFDKIKKSVPTFMPEPLPIPTL